MSTGEILPNASPLIIEAAINGATSKEKNRHVPRTVDEIVESAVACLEAGTTRYNAGPRNDIREASKET